MVWILPNPTSVFTRITINESWKEEPLWSSIRRQDSLSQRQRKFLQARVHRTRTASCFDSLISPKGRQFILTEQSEHWTVRIARKPFKITYSPRFGHRTRPASCLVDPIPSKEVKKNIRRNLNCMVVYDNDQKNLFCLTKWISLFFTIRLHVLVPSFRSDLQHTVCFIL